MSDAQLLDVIQGAAREVYAVLGAGYSETVYEEAMAVEMRLRGLTYEIERTTEVFYKNEKVGTHRLDFVVAGAVVVELKAGTSIGKSHAAQLRSYMKTLKKDSGLLINFPYPEKDSGPDFQAEQL